MTVRLRGLPETQGEKRTVGIAAEQCGGARRADREGNEGPEDMGFCQLFKK